MPETNDFDPVPHEITVARLKQLLEELRDDDILVPNAVRNLSIYRAEAYVGYVDLNKTHQQIDLFAIVPNA